jgi:hypothetical protein
MLELSFNQPRSRAFMAEVELAIQRKPSKVVCKYGAWMWKSTIDKVCKSESNGEEGQREVLISSLGASLTTPINISASSHNPTSQRAKTYESSLEATNGQIMKISNTSKRKRKREGDDPLQVGGCHVQSMVRGTKQTGAAPGALGSARHQEPFSKNCNIPISSLLNIMEPWLNNSIS